MLRAITFACAFHVAVSIIVTDPPPVKPAYRYSYEIVDPTTGDTKSLYEMKHGNIVTGSYSVLDPDGVKRTVDYTADSKHGFQANIRNEPMTNHNILNGIPYSSLYQSHNYPMHSVPYVLKKNTLPTVENDVRYFSPGKGPDMEETFERGEYFKPNFRHI